MDTNEYNYLQSFLQNDFEMPDPNHDVVGWEIKNEAGVFLGKVTDLLYDTTVMTVRYLVMDLKDNGMNLADKKVMIPIGLASLHPEADEVVLPNLHIDQFSALPEYMEGKINPGAEQYTREVIGSPAALRMEEKITEFDQAQFYAHHHFDDKKFFSRAARYDTIPHPERAEEQNTIHELIERSLENDLHAAEGETGQNTHHNEVRKINENGKPGQEDQNSSLC